MDIKELIEDPSKLTADTLPELKALVEKYPFFQVARLLYIANLYKLHSKEFGAELRKASVFVPDRKALFELTEGVNYELPSMANNISIETEGDENRTISLINKFLTGDRKEAVESESDKTERLVPSLVDLTSDYASFLEQQTEQKETASPSTSAPKLKGAALIDNFIEETKGKQRLDIPEMANDEEVGDGEFVSPQFSDEDEEIYTESMVNIYIKQRRFQQALEILRKISLNNPKKSSNFAAQIKLLEFILEENK